MKISLLSVSFALLASLACAEDQATTAKPAPAVAASPALVPLQGGWEGTENGRESEGKCKLTVTGDSMRFQGANEEEWYEAKVTVPASSKPQQLNGKITAGPVPEMVGLMALAIFKIEEGKLTLAGNAPGAPAAPKDFAGSADTRVFTFKKAAHSK